MAVSILTGAIQINSLRNNANVYQGKTVANAWSHTSKTNFVFGQIDGNFNLTPTGVNILNDSDLLDTNIPNNGGQSPVTGGNAEVV